jgi:hypothetical protein
MEKRRERGVVAGGLYQERSYKTRAFFAAFSPDSATGKLQLTRKEKLLPLDPARGVSQSPQFASPAFLANLKLMGGQWGSQRRAEIAPQEGMR